jgi:hypothetical protein
VIAACQELGVDAAAVMRAASAALLQCRPTRQRVNVCPTCAGGGCNRRCPSALPRGAAAFRHAPRHPPVPAHLPPLLSAAGQGTAAAALSRRRSAPPQLQHDPQRRDVGVHCCRCALPRRGRQVSTRALERRELLQCCDARCRGSALLSRVAVDTFDSSARMRIVRPLRNIMRIECEAALAELCPPQEAHAGAESGSATEAAAAGGAASCIGDLMKGFVALLQVRRQSRIELPSRVTRLAG